MGRPGKHAENTIFFVTNFAVEPAEWGPPDLESQQTPAVGGPRKAMNVTFTLEVHNYSHGSHS